jgi:hypothetical protein
MPNDRRRVVSILCLLAFLALPLMAQPTRDSDLSLLGFVSALWERLTGATVESPSATSAWEADGTGESVPVPTPTPSPIETGRGGWDPNG